MCFLRGLTLTRGILHKLYKYDFVLIYFIVNEIIPNGCVYPKRLMFHPRAMIINYRVQDLHNIIRSVQAGHDISTVFNLIATYMNVWTRT